MLSFTVGLALVQGSLFKQVVTHPDELNGYDDYVRAAARIDTPEFGEFIGWDAYVQGGRIAVDKPPCPANLRDTEPELAVRERMVERFGQALALIWEGNQKAIYDPRDSYTTQTTFPELTLFRSLARLEAARAHVAFAHGRSSDATADLIQGIQFGNRLGVGPMIGRLVGLATQSILFRELSEHLPQLSLDDAEKLHACADEILNARGLASATIRADAKLSLGALDEVSRNPKSLDGLNDAQAALLSSINAQSDAQREQLKEQVAARIMRQTERVASILDGPEESWMSKINDLQDPNDGTIAGQFVSIMLPVYSGFVGAEAKMRARIRLLRLNAMAIEYRWLNGKLPDRISDFASEEDRRDPIGGGEFVYKRTSEWYTLISNGFGDTHNISLQGSPADAKADGPIRP